MFGFSLSEIHNAILQCQKKLEPWMITNMAMSAVCFLWQIFMPVVKVEKLLWLEFSHLFCIVSAFLFGAWFGMGLIRVFLKNLDNRR